MARPRTLSRRKLLALGSGAAGMAGVGAAAFFVTRESNSHTAPGVVDSVTLPSPTATLLPSPASTPVPRGGTARVVAAHTWNLDTFDAQRTGERSVVEILGHTHARLVDWLDFSEPRLGAALAATWEQPDSQTLVLHLDPAARWHDRQPVNGRAFVAQDAVLHLQRMLSLVRDAKLPALQSPDAYTSIAKVAAADDHTVRIETSAPDPFLLETLAGATALVQAPEAVEAFTASWQELHPETVIGSGPFTFDGFSSADARFSAFRDGHLPSALDALVVSPPDRDDADRFLAGERDEFIARDRRDAPRIRQAATGASESSVFEDSPIITTFFAGAPPWNNADLIRALSGALNRGELARRLLGGRAAPSALVTPATPAFALSDTDLAGFAGYRAEFSADADEARRRWEAAGGPALGPITVEFPSIFDPLYSASSVVIGQLNEVLGNQFRPLVDTYTAISARALDRQYGNGRAAFWFGWGPALASPDPSRFVIEILDRGGPNASSLGLAGGASLASAEIHRLSMEFGLDQRKELVRTVQRAHLSAGSPGLVGWLLQRDEIFRAPRFSRAPGTPFWAQHMDARAYLRDTSK